LDSSRIAGEIHSYALLAAGTRKKVIPALVMPDVASLWNCLERAREGR